MLALKRHVAYLKYVTRHKWYVWQEGRKLGVPIYLLLLHDMSKLNPREYCAYARTFYGRDGRHRYVENVEFAYAWNHHQKCNKHHWQYWVLRWDRGESTPLEMPDKYRREMLADWRSASRCLSGSDTVSEWYNKNYINLILHPATRQWIEEQLGDNNG